MNDQNLNNNIPEGSNEAGGVEEYSMPQSGSIVPGSVQGGDSEKAEYTYQNPTPYTTMQYTAPLPKQKKNKDWLLITLIVIALVAVAGIIAAAIYGSVFISDEDTDDYVQQQSTPQTDTSQDTAADNNSSDEKFELDIQTEQNGTELTIPQINRKVKDSVVGIIVSSSDGLGLLQDSGSGIIISEDGYIVTNSHVVKGAMSIKVVFSDSSETGASLVGTDSRSDLAVIKVDKDGLSPAQFGDSDALEVGEAVVAIGNPYGLELAGTVTSGIISALGRQIMVENVSMTLIQTDASINPGNSGGPLVNRFGQVIGITSSKLIADEYEGIGFAIPINGAKDIISELINHGYVKDRPLIGINGAEIDDDYARIYSLPEGIMVSYVDPECDAYQKGLRRGDVITEYDGQPVTSMAQLQELKEDNKAGDSVLITYYRNTKYTTIDIVLSEATD